MVVSQPDINEGPIRFFTRVARNISFEGWCGSHSCVTAAAACLPLFKERAKGLEYLRQMQHPDGSWEAYWWSDPEYPTAFALEAII